MLAAGHLVQGAEPLDLGGISAHDDEPCLGVQVAGGPAAADPGIEGDLGHSQVRGEVAQPPFMLAEFRPGRRGPGVLQAQCAEQVAGRAGGEGGGALGRPQSLGVEALGDLGGGASGSGQFLGTLPELREVAQLGQGRDRPGDAACRAVPAGPGDLDVYLLAGPEHGDADPFDEVPDQLLAVGVGGGGGVPDGGQVGGQRPDLVTFDGGERAGAGGGEPVVFLAEALPLGQRGLPVLFQLPGDQAVLRLDQLVLAAGPLGGVAGAFQALPPDQVDLVALGLDLPGSGQRDL